MMLAFGTFSPIHWAVIGIVALLLFGNRLPEVARSIGRSINEFKKGMREVKDEFDGEGDKDDPPKRKLKSPGDEEAPHERVAHEKRREAEHAESGNDD